MDKYLDLELTEDECLALIFAITNCNLDVFKGGIKFVNYNVLSGKLENAVLKECNQNL